VWLIQQPGGRPDARNQARSRAAGPRDLPGPRRHRWQARIAGIPYLQRGQRRL